VKLLVIPAACAAAVLLTGAGVGRPEVRIPARALHDSIRHLSAPEMTGRGAGTEGLNRAAVWLENQFRQAGLRPAFPGSFQQSFLMTSGAALGSRNELRCTGCPSPSLALHEEFLPLAMSADADIETRLAFAGYGITAPECGYDDYAGIDVKGRAVLILRHEPQEYDSNSVFEGRIYTEHAQTMRKVLNARDHGAAAVILVQDAEQHGGATDKLEALNGLPGPGNAGIPVIQVTAAVASAWIAHAGGDLPGAERTINETLKPQSFQFPDEFRLQMAVGVTSTQIPVSNVGGYVPGQTDEYVIVGAHYDHLGHGEQYSLAAESSGTLHPGADDNASGTAGLLAMAQWFARQPPMRRGVLFLAFAGEELGLLGSTHYAAGAALPLDRAVAMINMDMIGRLRERKLIVGGAGSGEGLRSMLEDLGRRAGMELQMDEHAVYGSSDHAVFRARSLPVLFFFTGLHADYHRPTDTADKIDPRNVAKVVELAGSAVYALAQNPVKTAVVLPKHADKNSLMPAGLGR
jgi:hypothetical protein